MVVSGKFMVSIENVMEESSFFASGVLIRRRELQSPAVPVRDMPLSLPSMLARAVG
jgi:hypothetical protein